MCVCVCDDSPRSLLINNSSLAQLAESKIDKSKTWIEEDLYVKLARLQKPVLELVDTVHDVAFGLDLHHDVVDRAAPPSCRALRGGVDGRVAAITRGDRPAGRRGCAWALRHRHPALSPLQISQQGVQSVHSVQDARRFAHCGYHAATRGILGFQISSPSPLELRREIKEDMGFGERLLVL